jgi:hypothetical protein
MLASTGVTRRSLAYLGAAYVCSFGGTYSYIVGYHRRIDRAKKSWTHLRQTSRQRLTLWLPSVFTVSRYNLTNPTHTCVFIYTHLLKPDLHF